MLNIVRAIQLYNDSAYSYILQVLDYWACNECVYVCEQKLQWRKLSKTI